MLLKEMLLSLTVDQIKLVASNWGIRGCSRLKKKGLVDKLSNFMLDDNNLREMLLRLKPDELKAVLNSEEVCAKYEEFLSSPIRFAVSVGLIFMINGQCVVPDDILDKHSMLETQEFKKENERFNRISDYIAAFVEFYGIIPAEKAVEIYQMHTGDELTVQEILDIADDCYRPPLFAQTYKECLAHESLFDYYSDGRNFDELYQKQKDKPFYIPQRDELFEYGNAYYPKLVPAGVALAEYFVRHFRINAETAVEIASEIQLVINIDYELMLILQLMSRMGVEIRTLKEMKEFATYLKSLARTVRLWALRGHNAEELDVKVPLELELENYTFSDNAKVGRNDPCPCGSGKKYKKCCNNK